LTGYYYFSLSIYFKDKLFNKEITPPYLPPPEKVITDSQINHIAEKKISILEELKVSILVLI